MLSSYKLKKERWCDEESQPLQMSGLMFRSEGPVYTRNETKY